MDNIDNNLPIFATRDEELPIVVYDNDQSATPNLEHATINLYYYTAMQFQNINMERLDYNLSTLPLSTSTTGALHHDAAAHVTTTPGFTLHGEWIRFGRYCGAWLALVAVYIATCAYLLEYTQLKTESPFQTHIGFIIMSIAALFMTLFTSGIVAYTNNDLQSLMKEHFSPVYDAILKSVLWFSSILTPLSLLLLLFVPHKFKWVGYLIVCTLFVSILAFNFHSLKRNLASRRVLGDFEMV